jgi:AraC-like DNA-binding protein
MCLGENLMLDPILFHFSEQISYVHTYKTLNSQYLNGVNKNSSHCHDLYEIYYFVSGHVDYFIENKLYEMTPGDLFVIRSDEFHSYRIKSQDTYEKISVRFPPELAAALSDPNCDLLHCFNERLKGEQNKIELTAQAKGEALNTFVKLEAFEKEKTIPSILKTAYLIELLVIINQAFNKSIKPDLQDSKASERLKPLLYYINENLEGDLSLSVLSETFHMSISSLCSVFKDTTGVNIHKYITFKRIAKAKDLLRNGLSVSECCSACGFNDYAHFIRAFKNHTGMPPGKYSSSGNSKD